MGSVPPELSLDFKPTFVPKTISDFLKEVSMIGNVSEKLSKLDDFVKRLEDEMRKIDAFKRELPLCMFLLNDAIRALKEDAMQCAAPKVQPVLEEFIPMKKDCDKNKGGSGNNNKKEKDSRDKKNWMSSVQLWNTDNYHQHPSSDSPYDRKRVSEIDSKRNEAENGVANEDPFQTCRNRTGGRAFMPFKGYPAFSVTPLSLEEKEELPVHGLSLLTPGIKNPKEESTSSGSRSTCGRSVSFSTANTQSNMRTPPQQPTSRKQRRCWSPELHRRFVNALQQLGGSQVATPKQIRELMQVDGLTNDEVKSHLQGADSWKLEPVVDLLKQGAVGVVPTDTVYALVCDLRNNSAIERLRRIKNIDPLKPLGILCHSFHDIDTYTTGFPRGDGQGHANLFRYVKQCIPGPYTFILTATKQLPKNCIRYGMADAKYKSRKDVGVRMPDDPICQAILEKMGSPLISTSVKCPKENEWLLDPVIIADTYGPEGLDFIVDGGVRVAEPSTVVDMKVIPPKIIRQGKGPKLHWMVTEDDNESAQS